MGRVSIRERVGLNAKDTIASIRESAGYHVSVTQVTRFKTSAPDVAFLPMASVYLPTDELAPEGRSLPYEYRFASVVVELYAVRPQDDDDIDPLVNQLLDDVYTSMLKDPHRGGFAIDTLYQTAGVLLEQYAVGVQVTFLVKYRFLYQDSSQPVGAGQ